MNLRTGELYYSNGGHNPPYLVDTNGDIEAFELTGGMALGGVNDFQYQSKRIVLKKGETVFLYTDGVTEAMNERNELFSDDRLEKQIRALEGRPVREIAVDIMKGVEAFTKGVPQSDDITMMILKYHGE